MLSAVALAVGAALVLLVVPVARRTPIAAGAGLVLLLVAVLRALGEAGRLAGAGVDVTNLSTWVTLVLLALGLTAGTGLRALTRRRTGLRGPVAAAGVVLAHLPLLADHASATYDVVDSYDAGAGSTPATLLLLVGLLAGGALAAARPGSRTAAVAVAALVAGLLLGQALDPTAVRAVTSAAALAVLVPLLVDAVREASGPVGTGVLAGLVLVLLAAGAQGVLAERDPGRIAGSAVLQQETHDASFTDLPARPPLVPELDLLSQAVVGLFVTTG